MDNFVGGGLEKQFAAGSSKGIVDGGSFPTSPLDLWLSALRLMMISAVNRLSNPRLVLSCGSL